MLPRQMSPRQLESVIDVPRNLPLKFGHIGSVTAEIFGGGCSCWSCSSCDRGKTKSTPSLKTKTGV